MSRCEYLKEAVTHLRYGRPGKLEQDKLSRNYLEHGLGITKLIGHERRYPEQTGAIWLQPASTRTHIVNRVCAMLEHEYGSPRLGNPDDSLDDLIFIMLSNRTSSAAAIATYVLLKQKFPSWEHLLQAPPARLRKILKPIGLAHKRTHHILSALWRIKCDVGSCDLSFLHQLDDKSVHAFLVSLPGVSDKISKCVMMYTLGRQVLPVDTHVHRVSRRLGWINRKRADQCHKELESLIPPPLRYGFHVACIMHGRTVCRAARPLCDKCIIRHDCDLYQTQCGTEQ